MSQYKLGTVSATNGSAVITGVSTYWLTNVSVGDLININNDGVWFSVLTVDSDTQITLSTPYSRPTASNIAYTVQRDFTPNNSFPTPSYGDENSASLIALSLMKIDALLASLSPLNSIIEGEITIDGNISALSTGFVIEEGIAPATSSSTGVKGTVILSGDHLYICIATNTWKRLTLSTW